MSESNEFDDKMVPHPPNDSGKTTCIVRWIVETPNGWIGAWDKEAFDAYVEHVIAQREDK